MRRRPLRSSVVAESESGPERAERYLVLTARLDALRHVLARDQRVPTAVGQARDDHAELSRMLEDAVSQSFAADAVHAPTPAGMTSWSAEGLARSQERELALLAASDVSGLARVLTAPNLRWGGTEL
jgi:hypothetical protein